MADQPRTQRRGRKIAMSPAELDAYLNGARTCRAATVGRDGPRVTPLWFVWDRTYLWLYSIVRSQRWTDVQRDPRVGIVVDDGHDYLELRGVEITGSAEVVGEVPRIGAAPDELLAAAERQFASKYSGSPDMFHDGRHAWLRITPAKIVSWDFRKLAAH